MADIEYGDDSEDEEGTERNSSRAAAGAYSGYSGEEEEEEEVGSSLATSDLVSNLIQFFIQSSSAHSWCCFASYESKKLDCNIHCSTPGRL